MEWNKMTDTEINAKLTQMKVSYKNKKIKLLELLDEVEEIERNIILAHNEINKRLNNG